MLAVGDGKTDKDGNLVPVPVKVGDKVIYGKYAEPRSRWTAKTCSSSRADDLYAVFE